MTTALFFAALLIVIAALLVAHYCINRTPATRPTNTRARRTRPASPRAATRKPTPGKGTARRPRKCARCKGPILTNEPAYRSRIGWTCPGCSIR
ncbi:hypothetical protein ACGF7U_12630 [Micromonospora sp. NPDC047670]|uniref:hypothetical protein n=1 Tax=Micromonospora sp. NPDC047670 TaxID=3364252 RepID=UPI00371C5A61